ncbi:transposable element Tc1 transposase [Trichonephila clavipes]|nr:transposable element Tc1 transposase [Trichonephila clavipes]
MVDNERLNRTLSIEELLESEDITRMDWPAYSPDLNPIKHVCYALGRRIAARLHHPENTQQLKQMLIEEWVLLPQEMLHQLVLSMRRRCETTIAVNKTTPGVITHDSQLKILQDRSPKTRYFLQCEKLQELHKSSVYFKIILNTSSSESEQDEKLRIEEQDEKLRIEERDEKLRIEQLRLDEQKCKYEFELEKLRIQTQSKLGADTSKESDTKFLVKEVSKFIHRFDLKEDISLYPKLFQRQAQRLNIDQENWVSHLLGLLPTEVSHIIAREPDDKANSSKHVKDLLLICFKLTPEKF